MVLLSSLLFGWCCLLPPPLHDAPILSFTWCCFPPPPHAHQLRTDRGMVGPVACLCVAETKNGFQSASRLQAARGRHVSINVNSSTRSFGMLLMVGDGCKKWEVDVDRIKFPFEPGPALAGFDWWWPRCWPFVWSGLPCS